MEWLNIKKDDSRTRKLFLSYHHYEWRNKFTQQKLWYILLPAALVLFIFNITSGQLDKDYNLFYFTTVSFFVITYLPFRYLFQMVRLYKSLRRISAETPSEFKFRYDERGTFYQDHEMSEHQSWDEFKYYSINKNEIYLYNHQGFVQQIIAEKVIGPAHYKKVSGIIKKRLRPRHH